jgi:hypothetical protein
MPAMIAALFKDFPGKSGETISVSAPLQRSPAGRCAPIDTIIFLEV